MMVAKVCVAISFVALAEGNAFLRSKTLNDIEKVGVDDVQKSLLAEIEGEFGSAATKGRLARLEAALSPMFRSLPKNEFGKLGHATTKYALHRLFVQRHGWYIKGLEPSGDSWHTESSISILKDQATSYIQELFEKKLGNQGFGIHELAILASTVEHLILDEAHERLDKAFALSGQENNSTLSVSHDVAGELLDTYIKFFILGEETGSTISSKRMEDVYPGWKETQNFVRGVLQQVMASGADVQPQVSHDVLTKTVEEVGEQFGRFQNYECKAMKNQLLQLGDQGIGRVRLSDFYGPALDAKTKGKAAAWQFTESVDYLRQVGALDDTNPSNPSVIVPNYVASSSNCLASSSYYSVCCIDECEEIMSKLEHEVAAPEATPTVISSLVATYSTSTVEGPRTLSDNILRRLDEIAATHDGTVPLHGKLFAQWMHHAFPRECSLPRTSAENPHTPDDWLSASVRASKDEMEMHATNAAEMHEDFDHEEHLNNGWTHEEQLLVPRRKQSSSGMWVRALMLCAALAAIVLRMLGASKEATNALRGIDSMTYEKRQSEKWTKADKFV